MVSVCIATYNGEKYVCQQLDSILKQLSADDEVIISDDGSKDATLALVAAYNDNRIKVFHHPKDEPKKRTYLSSFMYATLNFEHAINQAKGDYIFLCDQDDIWADNRVASMSKALEECDYALCNFSLIDADGKVIKEKVYDANPVSPKFLTNLYKMPFRGCTMAFRRSALQGILPLPPKCVCHDNWIGLCMSFQKLRFCYLAEPLHLYRTHANNVSPVLEKSPNSLYFKLAYRFRFLCQIWRRFH